MMRHKFLAPDRDDSVITSVVRSRVDQTSQVFPPTAQMWVLFLINKTHLSAEIGPLLWCQNTSFKVSYLYRLMYFRHSAEFNTT